MSAINAVLEEALRSVNRGWAVFPVWGVTPEGKCRCGSAHEHEPNQVGKHPLGALVPHGVKDATRDEAVVREWWTRYADANLAVATGKLSGFDALDVDGEEGEATVAALEKEHGAIPKTVEQISGSGSRHVCFAHAAELKNGVKFAPGLDLRTTGGYVLVEPSCHRSSRAYAWDATRHPDETPFAPWPAWLLDKLPKRGAEKSKGEAEVPEDVLDLDQQPPEVVERARKYLSEIEGAVSGQHGHDKTFRAACKIVRGFALPLSQALPLLREWNLKCKPPWSEKDLVHKINDALKKKREKDDGRIGWLRDAKRERPVHAAPPRGSSADDGGRARDAARGSLPAIRCGPNLHQNTNEAEDALSRLPEPRVYTRARGLVVVAREDARPIAGVERDPGAPFIHGLAPAAVREHLSRAASWLTWSRWTKGWVESLPPNPVVAALSARGAWPRLLPLAGIVEAPTLRPDGSILDRPGYDNATGLLFDPRGVTFPAVPSNPTAEDVKTAVAALWEPFEQFEWDDPPVDRAVVTALMLTFAARPAFERTAPCFAFDSTTRGSGKGLACAVAVMAATGRQPAVSLLSPEPEEQRKALFALALEGHRAILLDNMTRPLGGSVLSLCLTAGEIRDRVLGASRSATAPFEAILLATGNNLRYVGDFDRRVLVARQVPTVEKPEERQPEGGFRHLDLFAYVAAEHPRLLAAALTILRAYHVAGRPAHGKAPLGSFESWDALVRGACIYGGAGDPLACRERVEGVDEDREHLGALLTAWHETLGKEAVTVAQAVSNSAPGSSLRLALAAFDGKGDPDHSNVASISNRLKAVVGRIVGGMRLEKASRASPVTYRVAVLERGPANAPSTPRHASPPATAAEAPPTPEAPRPPSVLL
jgi:hypothetical protein